MRDASDFHIPPLGEIWRRTLALHAMWLVFCRELNGTSVSRAGAGLVQRSPGAGVRHAKGSANLENRGISKPARLLCGIVSAASSRRLRGCLQRCSGARMSHELSVSHAPIGDVRMAQGTLAAALTSSATMQTI